MLDAIWTIIRTFAGLFGIYYVFRGSRMRCPSRNRFISSEYPHGKLVRCQGAADHPGDHYWTGGRLGYWQKWPRIYGPKVK